MRRKSSLSSLIISFLLIVIIAGAVAVFYNVFSSSSKVNGDSASNNVNSGDSTSNITNSEVSTKSFYQLDCIVSGAVTNAVDYDLEFPDKIYAGETVSVSFKINNEDYIVTGFNLESPYGDTVINYSDDKFTFVVPEYQSGKPFMFWIYTDYSSESSADRYKLSLDYLGKGNYSWFNVEMPSYAYAGDSVTVTISILDEYSAEYEWYFKITRDNDSNFEIIVENGTTTFTMPADDVIVTIYCIEN